MSYFLVTTNETLYIVLNRILLLGVKFNTLTLKTSKDLHSGKNGIPEIATECLSVLAKYTIV